MNFTLHFRTCNIVRLITSPGLAFLPAFLKMVYYFTSNTVTPSAFIYVGKDKVESLFLSNMIDPRTLPDRTLTKSIDEELIKHGWEEDVWFHVDNLSSAHIYVRLPEGESWEKISEPLLTDCAQLTKANSIEGEYFDHRDDLSMNERMAFDMS
jgi:hypothetical protein